MIQGLMPRRAKSARASRLDVGARRDQLLGLGLELFGQRSYESISIDDIAKAAGISRGLLYHYFRNKRGFYVESVRFGASMLRERIMATRDLEARAGEGGEDPGHRRVELGLQAYLDFVAGFGGAYVTLMRSGIGFDPEVCEILEQTRAAIVTEMLEAIGARAPETEAARELVRVAARGWLGMVEFASLEWLERKAVPQAALIELLIQSLEHALVAAGVRLEDCAPEA